MFDWRLVVKGFGPLPDSYVRRFLLRGVRTLAALLGAEEATEVLLYSGVVPCMLDQMAPSQPLAENNQDAWALVLDDDCWGAACPKRLRGASRELCRLIRFYISIADGACTVERDFGELRAHMIEHHRDRPGYCEPQR